jgi:hypothetical protein
LLLSGNQAETSNERDKKIALLERDIKSLMFERNVRQELANNTILEVLKIRAINSNLLIIKPFLIVLSIAISSIKLE